MSKYLKSITFALLIIMGAVSVLPAANALAAPQRERLDTKQGPPSGVVVKDGRLVFENTEAFNAFMEIVVNQPDEELDALEEALEFLSMRRWATQQKPPAENPDADEDYWMTVPDPFFATVLNPDGMIQIGKNVYQVIEDELILLQEKNIDLLEDIDLASADLSEIEGIEVLNNENDGVSIKQSNKICYDRKGKFRLKGYSWIANYAIYNSAGSRSTFQRKALIGWVLAPADSISYNAAFNLNGSSGTSNGTLFNDVKIQRVHAWNVFGGILGSVGTDHQAIAHGKTYTCHSEDSAF